MGFQTLIHQRPQRRLTTTQPQAHTFQHQPQGLQRLPQIMTGRRQKTGFGIVGLLRLFLGPGHFRQQDLVLQINGDGTGDNLIDDVTDPAGGEHEGKGEQCRRIHPDLVIAQAERNKNRQHKPQVSRQECRQGRQGGTDHARQRDRDENKGLRLRILQIKRRNHRPQTAGPEHAQRQQ